jgi:predicted ATPase
LILLLGTTSQRGFFGLLSQAVHLSLTDEASKSIALFDAGFLTLRPIGHRVFVPWYLSNFATAAATLGDFDKAWSSIREAVTMMDTTKETWTAAEVHRTAGELALMMPAPDVAKAEAHFEQALAIARQQQAKSWELRAAMSMARLWREQGRRDEARDLLAPVYGWFTDPARIKLLPAEGFDTLDLKQAKALLDELAR